MAKKVRIEKKSKERRLLLFNNLFEVESQDCTCIEDFYSYINKQLTEQNVLSHEYST